MKIISLLILFIAVFNTSFAQTTSPPEIGKPCPEFTLDHVTHYPKKQVTLNDFKGKWLFLDFWGQTCISCIRSFPKVNQLQQIFKDEVQFLLVGTNTKKWNGNIEKVFDKLSEKQGWNMASAYDSVLGRSWGVPSVPYIVIVDPEGIVRHITDGRDMTKEKIQGLVEGKEVSFFPTDLSYLSLDTSLTGDMDNDLLRDKMLYHSILTRWNGEQQYTGYDIDRFVNIRDNKNGFRLTGVHLFWLYNNAYFGRYYFKVLIDSLNDKICQIPILEVKNASVFDYDYTRLDGGRYNYRLFVPPNKVTKENMMNYMQQDLERAFGYHAFVEERNMPVWKLVAKPGIKEKIRTKGGNPVEPWNNGSTAAGFITNNVSMRTLFSALFYYVNEIHKEAFVDATGITGNIDFTIDADMTDINDIRKELQKQGLDLVKGEKKMKVLVIHDSQK